MTTDQALLKIAGVTAQAVADALHELCGLQSQPGAAKLVSQGVQPLDDVVLPAVVARVAYAGADGGSSVIALPVAPARALAAAMMGAEPPADAGAQLSEIEQSALTEAIRDALTAAAGVVGALLGDDVEPGVPEIEHFATGPVSPELEVGTHAVRVDLTLDEASISLVHLVPDGFAQRLVGALDASLTQHDGAPLQAALRDIPVRVCVELGRATMPLGSFVSLPAGEVVELDRAVDDPVELYVDGMRVARGRLAISDSGEFLTLVIESLVHADGALAAHAAAVPLAGSAAAA